MAQMKPFHTIAIPSKDILEGKLEPIIKSLQEYFEKSDHLVTD